MESGCSSMSQDKGKKSERTRRAWTDKEEQCLVHVMKDLVANGWRGDNGFMPGYLSKVESEMVKLFPGTDLRANPHINSKLTAWKKCYGSLTTALQRTGVGFDDKTNTIEVTDEEFKEAVRVDPGFENMRHKSWPLFKDWREIFGKDRATGEHAEDVMEAVNRLMNECNAAAATEAVEQTPAANVNPEGVDEAEVSSHAEADRSANRPRAKGKKRPLQDVSGSSNEELYTFLQTCFRSTEDRIDNMARVIGYESNLGNARKELFTMVGSIPDITLDEKLDACHLLAKNTECLEMFIGLPEEARARYGRRLLAGEFWR